MTSNTEQKDNNPKSKSERFIDLVFVFFLAIVFIVIFVFTLFVTVMTRGTALPEFISFSLVLVFPVMVRMFYLEKKRWAPILNAQMPDGKKVEQKNQEMQPEARSKVDCQTDQADVEMTPQAQATADWQTDVLFAGLAYMMLAAYMFRLGAFSLQGKTEQIIPIAGWALLILSFIMAILTGVVLVLIAHWVKVKDYIKRQEDEEKHQELHRFGILPKSLKYIDTATGVKWLRFSLAFLGFCTVFGVTPFSDIFKF